MIAFTGLLMQSLSFDVMENTGRVTEQTLRCLQDSEFNYSHVVFPAQNGAAFDINVIANFKAASKLQYFRVDYYIMPASDKSPKEQIQQTMKRLIAANAISTNTTIWLDAETTHSYFSTQQENQKFISELIDELLLYIIPSQIGIFSDYSSWRTLFGKTFSISQFKLWYSNYNERADFEDFGEFGGWTEPAMKQYKGYAVVCDVELNQNVVR
ncbi:Glycosyl_hydrolase family 25 protein [Hexamita inflata]|uniref:Glycosyl hydrolase family 25 protein n=1 Tax=Hexamita inflata TaxID=28002 RepID=A0AA86PB39_9EUKA|nr:Glycosyl hydrolase family 25 protein [Hexamita inflata]